MIENSRRLCESISFHYLVSLSCFSFLQHFLSSSPWSGHTYSCILTTSFLFINAFLYFINGFISQLKFVALFVPKKIIILIPCFPLDRQKKHSRNALKRKRVKKNCVCITAKFYNNSIFRILLLHPPPLAAFLPIHNLFTFYFAL